MKKRLNRFAHTSLGLILGLTINCQFAVSKPNLPFQHEKDFPKTNHTQKSEQIDSVSVTSSRIPMTLGNSTRIVSILDSISISKLPVVSINDILKYSVGIDVRQRGDMGAQTDISFRGGTSDQMAVFLNGINICDPQTGHNAIDFPINVSDIERIELLSGPAGVAYGSSSLLGAVNIITKKAEDKSISAHFEGGSYGYFDGGVQLAAKTGEVSNSISAGYLRSDGFSRSKVYGNLNSDYQTIKTFYQGSWKCKDISLDWQAGLSSRDFGSNTFYSAKFDNQFEHTFKSFVALQAQTNGKIKFKPSIYWNFAKDRFELIRDNSSSVAFNHHKTNVFGVNLNAWTETIIGKTAFGAEMRNEGIISTGLGESLTTPIPIYKYPENSYSKGLNRTNISFFLEHSYSIKGFAISAGTALVKNTGNNDKFKFYPAVNMAYSFAGYWKSYLSYNSSLRMPTFTELYYSVGGHAADKNLKAERMQAVEWGLRFARSGINANIVVYYNYGKDMIDWIKNLDEEDAPWRSVNFTEIHTVGQEVSVRLNFPQILDRKDFFLQAFDISYAHINQFKPEYKNIESRYALEYLRHKIVGKIDFKIWKGLYLNAAYRWQDRVGEYEVFNFNQEENKYTSSGVENYKPYSLIDARISWSDTPSIKWLSDYSIYLEINNMLNKTYYDYGNIPQPGIIVKAGVSFKIGK